MVTPLPLVILGIQIAAQTRLPTKKNESDRPLPPSLLPRPSCLQSKNLIDQKEVCISLGPSELKTERGGLYTTNTTGRRFQTKISLRWSFSAVVEFHEIHRNVRYLDDTP